MKCWFSLAVTGTILILRANADSYPAYYDYDDPSTNEGDGKIKSGIVFLNRGSVLLTGEDWIVAKEFNITDVAELVNEAKLLFPSIKSRLENSTYSEEENIWDLQFFRDSINQEIDVIEPIITKIEDKIKIFENMLPKDEESVENDNRKKRELNSFSPAITEEMLELLENEEGNEKLTLNRKKRGFWSFIKGIGNAIAGGIGRFVGRTLFGSSNREEIQELNRKYNEMLYYKKQEAKEREINQMYMKYIDKHINIVESDMKTLEYRLQTMREEHTRDMNSMNSRVYSTIDKMIILGDKVHQNSNKIKKLDYELKIMREVHERKINSLNNTLINIQVGLGEVNKTLIKHYTIMNDLEVKTNENRKSIYDVRKDLAQAMSIWQRSQKQMVEKLNMVVNITSTMRMMEMQLLSMDTYLTGLLEALDTIATGRLSPNLISPIQLVDILKDVEENLPPGVYPLTLIREDAVYEYYTYADVYAIAIPGAIRVFIKLPLKAPKRMYYLFQPYSLPFYHEEVNVFLEIDKPSDFVLVSYDSEKVAEISSAVLRKCKHKNQMYLCTPTFPIYEGKRCSLSLIKDDEDGIINSCERSVVVSNFKSKWIRTEGGWIYSVPRTTNLNRVDTRDSSQIDSVSDTGFLKDIPNTYTYVADGTVLFPNDKFGENRTDAFKEGLIFIPKVPNLLLLSESSKIAKSELENVIEELSKTNTVDTEKVNLHSILRYVKAALFSEAPQTSSNALVTVLAVAVIVNYAILGFMCWSRTKKNVIDSKRNDFESINICDE